MSPVALSAPSRLLGVFSAELRKARSFPQIPGTLVLGVIAVLVLAVFVLVQTSQFLGRGREEELGGMTTADLMLIVLHYGQVIPILLGAWVVGQDLPVGPRHTAFLATGRRRTLFTVKLVTAAMVALVSGVACVVAALLPVVVAGGATTGTVSLGPLGWLIGYWVVVAVVTAALVAATRSITFSVVPILVWTLGLSDLLAAQIPALSGALDQVFKYAYFQGGAVPPTPFLIAAVAQSAAAVVLGEVLYARRDVR